MQYVRASSGLNATWKASKYWTCLKVEYQKCLLINGGTKSLCFLTILYNNLYSKHNFRAMSSEIVSASNLIYIGHLTLDADLEKLRQVLNKFGEIQEFRHVRARNGKCLNVFVSFNSSEQAKALIEAFSANASSLDFPAADGSNLVMEFSRQKLSNQNVNEDITAHRTKFAFCVRVYDIFGFSLDSIRKWAENLHMPSVASVKADSRTANDEGKLRHGRPINAYLAFATNEDADAAVIALDGKTIRLSLSDAKRQAQSAEDEEEHDDSDEEPHRGRMGADGERHEEQKLESAVDLEERTLRAERVLGNAPKPKSHSKRNRKGNTESSNNKGRERSRSRDRDNNRSDTRAQARRENRSYERRNHERDSHSNNRDRYARDSDRDRYRRNDDRDYRRTRSRSRSADRDRDYRRTRSRSRSADRDRERAWRYERERDSYGYRGSSNAGPSNRGGRGASPGKEDDASNMYSRTNGRESYSSFRPDRRAEIRRGDYLSSGIHVGKRERSRSRSNSYDRRR